MCTIDNKRNIHIISIFYSLGQVFAIAPINLCKHKKINMLAKVYAITMIIVPLYSITKWYLLRKIYFPDYTQTKIVAIVARHVLLPTVNIFAIIASNFTKKSQWNSLLRLLNGLLLHDNETKAKKSHLYLEFLIGHVLFCANFYVSAYIYCNCYSGTFEEIVLRFPEWYITFFYNFLMYKILQLIRKKYRLVTNFLRTETNKKHNINTRRTMNILSEMYYSHNKLTEIVDIYNNIFGWLSFLIICCLFLTCLEYIDHFYDPTLIILQNNLVIIGQSCYVIFNFLCCILPIIYCGFINDEAKLFVRTLFLFLRNVQDTSGVKEKEKLIEFIEYVRYTMPEFSAAGFFVLNRSTVCNIFGTLITFLIVMIQFHYLI